MPIRKKTIPPPNKKKSKPIEHPFKSDDSFFYQLVESLEDYAIFTTDTEGYVNSWNSGAQKLFGFTEKEIIGENAEILYTPEDIRTGKPKKELRTSYIKGRAVNERWHVRKDGSIFWGSGLVFPLRDETGGVQGFTKIMRDLTERREGILKIKQSEDRYRAFIQNSTEGIWRFELEKPLPISLSVKSQIDHFYKYAYLAECNDSVAKMYGYKKAGDITGMRLGTFLVRESQQNIEYLTAFITSGYSLTEVESEERDKKGKTKYFVNSLIGVIEDKKLLRAWGTQKDITEVKKTEASYKQLAEIVESSDDAIVSRTFEGKTLTWNKGAEKMFGYTAQEMIGKDAAITIPKENRREATDISEKIKQGKHIDHFETTRIKKDGTIIDISLSVSPATDPSGKVIGISAIARDITEQKKTVSALARLADIVETSPDSILSRTLDGKITSWNKGAEKMYGFTAKEALNNGIAMTIPAERKHEAQVIVDAIKQGKQVTHFETVRQRKDGSLLDVSISVSPIKDNSGKLIGISTIARDITEMKKLQQQKDDFIAIASHELKTPVTSIKAYTQVLESRYAKKGDKPSVDLLAKMESQINKLNNLIGDLLDVTKIEAGRLQLHHTQFDFNELVNEIVEEMQRTTSKHTILTNLSPSRTIHGDRERISQVMMNLISNAIKYSPHATKIHITSRANADTVTFCVKDFGVGIPKRKQEKIFERFFRVSGPNQNTFPGMGLGLYISSEIIKRQGGRIWVESIPKKGSTFCFILPTKKTASKKGSVECTE